MLVSPTGLLEHLGSYSSKLKKGRRARKAKRGAHDRRSSRPTSSISSTFTTSASNYTGSDSSSIRSYGSSAGSRTPTKSIAYSRQLSYTGSATPTRATSSTPAEHESQSSINNIADKAMPHNGLSDNPYATAVRHPKLYNVAGREPGTNGYQAYTPPRKDSTGGDAASWTTMPEQQRRTSGAGVSSTGSRRGSVPVAYHRNDVVSRHLLVETALLDSQNFERLPIEEVDALKKEKAQLEVRLNASRKKLAMESKVRDAAQSLHRLYTDGDDDSSPTSPNKKQRASFLTERGRSISSSHKKASGQTQEELATSQKKIDELLQILSGLESRRQYVESRLLRHTSAILQEAHQEQQDTISSQRSTIIGGTQDSERNLIDITLHGLLNGSGYEESIYSKSGRSNGNTNDGGSQRQRMDKVSTDTVMALQARLDNMNGQIRSLIQLARGEKAGPDKEDPEYRPSSRSGDDPLAYLDTQVDLVDKNVARLAEECGKARDGQQGTQTQLAAFNKRLYLLLQANETTEAAEKLKIPPVGTSQGVSAHLDYLSESMHSLENVLQGRSGTAAREAEEATAKVAEYNTAMHGLWDIVTANSEKQEPFSLAGFRTRIQHLFDKTAHNDQQVDILRRQIQQQRELNNKSDSEKDKQLAELQSTRTKLEAELSEVRERHAAAEAESHGARAEIDNVAKELETLRVATESHEKQKQAVLDQLTESRDEARLAGAERDAKHQVAAKLEAEMVRLTTELTMAKAELDAAHGSRAERAREQSQSKTEVETLRKELAEMASEYQDLTKESVEVEKEREALEGVVDALREKCEALETQISEDKVRWLGVSSPSVTSAGAASDGGRTDNAVTRETTSATVLRTEFKKMIRETRAENARLLRAEQDERKKLEAIIRDLRRQNGTNKASAAAAK